MFYQNLFGENMSFYQNLFRDLYRFTKIFFAKICRFTKIFAAKVWSLMSLVISVIKYLSFHINKEKAARISCENILAAFCLASQLQLISYQFVVSTSLGCQ